MDKHATRKRTNQYTIRHVPEHVDRKLREVSAQYGTSMNQTTLEALSRGLGVTQQPAEHHDLDDLIGTWVKDPAFDKAVKSIRRIDPGMWK